MYSVFAMISAYDRSTSPRPVSTGQPGWTQEISPASRRVVVLLVVGPGRTAVSQSAESSSKSPRSIAS